MFANFGVLFQLIKLNGVLILLGADFGFAHFGVYYLKLAEMWFGIFRLIRKIITYKRDYVFKDIVQISNFNFENKTISEALNVE